MNAVMMELYRDPAWVKTYSNWITLMRLWVGAVSVILFALLKLPEVAFWLYIFWALTDIVDGEMARREGKPTVWGAHYDPMADKSLCDILLIYLCLSDFSAWMCLPAIVVIGYDGAMIAIRSGRPGMRASKIAKAKTFTLFFAIGSILGVRAGFEPALSNMLGVNMQLVPAWWPYAILAAGATMCLPSLVKYLRG